MGTIIIIKLISRSDPVEVGSVALSKSGINVVIKTVRKRHFPLVSRRKIPARESMTWIGPSQIGLAVIECEIFDTGRTNAENFALSEKNIEAF
jgi:hypothetical protein